MLFSEADWRSFYEARPVLAESVDNMAKAIRANLIPVKVRQEVVKPSPPDSSAKQDDIKEEDEISHEKLATKLIEYVNGLKKALIERHRSSHTSLSDWEAITCAAQSTSAFLEFSAKNQQTDAQSEYMRNSIKALEKTAHQNIATLFAIIGVFAMIYKVYFHFYQLPLQLLINTRVAGVVANILIVAGAAAFLSRILKKGTDRQWEEYGCLYGLASDVSESGLFSKAPSLKRSDQVVNAAGHITASAMSAALTTVATAALTTLFLGNSG